MHWSALVASAKASTSVGSDFMRPLPEIMRDKPAHIGGDRRLVLAHADPGGLAGDDPRADDGVHAVVDRQRSSRLEHPVVGFERGLARTEDAYPLALPAMHRLLHAGPADLI